MVSIESDSYKYLDIRKHSGEADLRQGIKNGLSQSPKELPSLLLWNETGLELYERLKADHDDYYPSRNEGELIRQYAGEIASAIPNDGILVELGSGNIEKTTLILSALQRQGKTIIYYALDVSAAELARSLRRLSKMIPPGGVIQCHGLLGTYEDGIDWLTTSFRQSHSVVTTLWLGNSIGNFSPEAATAILERFRTCSEQLSLRFIVGVDGCRDMDLMQRSYDPTSSLTRAFLSNGLIHANDVLGFAYFPNDYWTYGGSYDPTERSWKQYYVATRKHHLHLGGCSIGFGEGEPVLAIRSAKWTQHDMKRIVMAAGLKITAVWGTADQAYGLYQLHDGINK